VVDRPPALPIVDVEPLVEDGSASARTRAGAEIVRHCREVGFFCAVGHFQWRTMHPCPAAAAPAQL
jgi:isopenicillin N synthase-like dioxygenase